MAPNQDLTPPTTSRKHRPDRGFGVRPVLLWLAVGLALSGTGTLIALVSPPSGVTGLTVGFLLSALSGFVFVAIPGALVALRHPWGAGFRLVLEERYAHPRLVGLAEVWAGVVLSGGLGAISLLQYPFSLGLGVVLTLAVVLVALAPLLAITRFDRRC